MKIILILSLLLSTAIAAETFDLRGAWYRLGDHYWEKPVEFILVNGEYRTQSREKFFNRYGQLLYTIDQAVKLTEKAPGKFQGSVDFYDSRGCSFKALPVSGEAQDLNSVGFLMTVPRYKFRTVTKVTTGEVIRTECVVLETVESPVTLYRY